MRKLYSINGEQWEECYPKQYFIDMLKDDDARKSYILDVWNPVIGVEGFWCKYHGEAYESTKGICIKFECSEYTPRNGKSGCCKYRSNCFEPNGKTITIEK